MTHEHWKQTRGGVPLTCSLLPPPWCSEDPDHAKAHFRRAVARAHLGDDAGAAQDFADAARLDPGAAAEVDREVARIAARARAAEGRQRREMASFFDKAKK
jgi:hypothetical protein